MTKEKLLLFKDGQTIAAIGEEGYERDPDHKYIINAQSPPPGFISQGAMILTHYYLHDIKQSVSKWRKDRNSYIVNWANQKNGQAMASAPVNYLIFAEELRVFNAFNSAKFNLPPPECGWLDSSIDVSMNFHFVAKDAKEALFMEDGTPQQQYGEHYPIRPKIDREGHIYTTFQPQLIKRIIGQRQSLIDNSNNALYADWILELRELVNNSISLLDMTLNQLYIKAEYAPEPGWIFSKDKVGNKNGRRIKDKLRWIRQISGNELNIESEFKKLDRLRKLRNHFNHFDPPTLVVTIEEATEWINDVLYVGQILIKIREALKVPVSAPLISLICQKGALFNPEKGFVKRIPLKAGKSGYSTSVWTNEGDPSDE